MATQIDFEETELLKRIKNDDEIAFREVYNHYKKPLYIFLIRFIKVPSYTEDILQEVFLKTWEIRHSINPVLSFKAYLYKISRNAAFKSIKKTTANETMVLNLMHHFNADNNDASVQLEWKQFQKKLDDAVSHLPPKRQLVFMLCREEKKTYGEVAMLLGISKNTVKEHMVLAMRTIAAFLKPNANIYVLFILLVLTK